MVTACGCGGNDLVLRSLDVVGLIWYCVVWMW